MANAVQEKRHPGIFDDVKTRSGVLKEIQGNPVTHDAFLRLDEEFQERFVEFCMGVRGVKMTCDPFFKKFFNAEIYPERLSRFLSEILGHPLEVKRMLPNERQRITDMGSLMILDVLVEFATGELADVEIQKIGYRFPGQRASCYSSDMVMRQYERVKGIKGDRFTYRDMKKVYTIVIMENSTREFRKMSGQYIHRGKYEYDTGIEPEHLERMCYIALDNFLDIMDNKRKGTQMSELEAWLYFIGSDKVEHIYKVIESYPWFADLYREINEFRYHPEEAVRMFSDALRIMDRNTVWYMIDEEKQKRQKAEERAEGAEKRAEGAEQKLSEQQQELDKKEQEIEKLQTIIDGLQKK